MQCEYYYVRESYRVTATGSVESKMHRLAAAWEQQPGFGHIPVVKTSGLSRLWVLLMLQPLHA